MMGSKRRVHDILGPLEEPPRDDAVGDVLETILEEFVDAVKSGDAKAAAAAFKAAFTQCESDEGPAAEE